MDSGGEKINENRESFHVDNLREWEYRKGNKDRTSKCDCDSHILSYPDYYNVFKPEQKFVFVQLYIYQT